ncbi:HDOD domain-containing protein [Thermosulfuriphilus ammonigenes]|uniref:HDOD domain-containing protein n=1 Tax=Thermosulfuriphilus ammonigenes TaxID=1936021 RepID=A0A6G7PTG6_9BACT|nr:HDOD domain-containing protein [Thermosulfuriphilus ammonigenes]QIJ70910.1 HDOD domain-containing protein [Thermosulfuriphilus ammonigenes]
MKLSPNMTQTQQSGSQIKTKIQELAPYQNLRNRILQVEDLPTVPATILRLIESLGNVEVTVEELEDIIRYDQSLTSKVLSVANSAFYGHRVPITTVKRAIIALGLDEVRNIALSIMMISIFKTPEEFEDFSLNDFWLHSIAVGLGARIIAGALGRPDDEVFFVCGLLHDLGRAVLATQFPDEFRAILKVQRETGCHLLEAEASLDVPHTWVGRWLARYWKLPGFVIEAIRYHHHPFTRKGFKEVAAICQVADHLAHRYQIGRIPGGQEAAIGPVLKRLGLSEETFSELADQFEALGPVIVESWLSNAIVS